MSARRVELGFEGGAVLRADVEEGALQGLTAALTGDGGWYQLTAEDGTTWVDLGEVVYLRVPREPRGVGFSGS